MNGKYGNECLPEVLAKYESANGIENRKYAGDQDA
jgi:hypothetical protein